MMYMGYKPNLHDLYVMQMEKDVTSNGGTSTAFQTDMRDYAQITFLMNVDLTQFRNEM